jgi:hypothetical protein
VIDNEERAWHLANIWHSRTESRLAVLGVLAAAVALLNGVTNGKPAGTALLWVSFGLLLLSSGAYWWALRKVQLSLEEIQKQVARLATATQLRLVLGQLEQRAAISSFTSSVLTAANEGANWEWLASLLALSAYVLLLIGFIMRFFI